MTVLWRNSYALLVIQNRLVKISANCLLHADFEQKLRTIVTELLAEGKGATVSEICERLGTTRKHAIPFCEHLDRIGVTLRKGDLRFLRSQ